MNAGHTAGTRMAFHLKRDEEKELSWFQRDLPESLTHFVISVVIVN